MAPARKRSEHLAAEDLRERLRASNTAKQFGFVLKKAEPGHVILEMPVDDRHKQIHGVVHGGVIAALADTAGGLATYMASPRGRRVATIEMKINYLEAVADGTVRADAHVVRLGRARRRGGLRYTRRFPAAGWKSAHDVFCQPTKATQYKKALTAVRNAAPPIESY